MYSSQPAISSAAGMSRILAIWRTVNSLGLFLFSITHSVTSDTPIWNASHDLVRPLSSSSLSSLSRKHPDLMNSSCDSLLLIFACELVVVACEVRICTGSVMIAEPVPAGLAYSDKSKQFAVLASSHSQLSFFWSRCSSFSSNSSWNPPALNALANTMWSANLRFMACTLECTRRSLLRSILTFWGVFSDALESISFALSTIFLTDT